MIFEITCFISILLLLVFRVLCRMCVCVCKLEWNEGINPKVNVRFIHNFISIIKGIFVFIDIQSTYKIDDKRIHFLFFFDLGHQILGFRFSRDILAYKICRIFHFYWISTHMTPHFYNFYSYIHFVTRILFFPFP